MHRIWNKIREPLQLKVTYFFLYAITLWTGVVTLVSPPSSIEGLLGAVLTPVWSLFIILGGLLGLITVLPGWWATERLGIYAVFVGLGIYAGVVLSLQFTTAGGSRLTQFGIILMAAGLSVVRLLLIRKGEFEPRG